MEKDNKELFEGFKDSDHVIIIVAKDSNLDVHVASNPKKPASMATLIRAMDNKAMQKFVMADLRQNNPELADMVEECYEEMFPDRIVRPSQVGSYGGKSNE